MCRGIVPDFSEFSSIMHMVKIMENRKIQQKRYSLFKETLASTFGRQKLSFYIPTFILLSFLVNHAT